MDGVVEREGGPLVPKLPKLCRNPVQCDVAQAAGGWIGRCVSRTHRVSVICTQQRWVTPSQGITSCDFSSDRNIVQLLTLGDWNGTDSFSSRNSGEKQEKPPKIFYFSNKDVKQFIWFIFPEIHKSFKCWWDHLNKIHSSTHRNELCVELILIDQWEEGAEWTTKHFRARHSSW